MQESFRSQGLFALVKWICRKNDSKRQNSLGEQMSEFFSELTWDKIDWGNSYKLVRRSQRRIFKASKLGDIRKTRYLQQRLIRSPHAKLIAVQQVTTLNKGKSTPGVDGFVPTNRI